MHVVALDDTQERRELQGRLPNGREDAEVVTCGTFFVAAGVLLALASGVGVGAESLDVGSGDDVDVRDTWGMASDRPSRGYDRVLERRRAVALARHFRDAEGLSIGQIADRLGRSPATIKAYFYDPTGEKARAVKARYLGVCRGCGAYTQTRNGKHDAYEFCKCAARRSVVSPA